MKSFAIAIFLLLIQAAHAESHGLVTRGAKRRNLHKSVPGSSIQVDSKSFKTKESKVGKTKMSKLIIDDLSMSIAKSPVSPDLPNGTKKKSKVIIDDLSMSMMAKTLKSPGSSYVPKEKKNKSKLIINDSMSMMAKSLKTPGSPDFPNGAKKLKGAKSKHTSKSKEFTNAKSQSGKQTKSLGYIKMVRYSLPKSSEADDSDKVSETANTLRNANADRNNAYTHSIIGAIIALAPFVILGAFIAAS